jgi:hypothetical protein
VTVGVLVAALLAVNTSSVLTETAEASGEQIVRLADGDVHVVQSGPCPIGSPSSACPSW